MRDNGAMSEERIGAGRRRPPLRKRLGQHHLASPALCRPLLDSLAQARGGVERVVEIGPGGGVLTGELLSAGWPVAALELDPAWAFELRRRLPDPALRLALVDALQVRWSGLQAGTAVVGNLPYQISTALVGELLAALRHPTHCVFLVQREVAARLVAEPGSADYGALSVLVAARARARVLARVRPGSFVPPPRVESAFVALTMEPARVHEDDWSPLVATVHAAFAQRRKTLRNSLASVWGGERATAVAEAAGVDPRLRAEQLGVGELIALRDAARRVGVFA